MIFIHWRVNRLINKYLSGVLSETDRISLDKHMAQCTSCRHKLEREKQFVTELETAFHSLDTSWNKMKSQLDQLSPPPTSIHEPGLNLIQVLRYRQIRNWAINTVYTLNAAVASMCIVWFSLYSSATSSILVSNAWGTGFSVQSSANSTWAEYKLQNHNFKNVILNPSSQIQTDDVTSVQLKLWNIGDLWMNHSSRLSVLGDSMTPLDITRGGIYVSVSHLHNTFKVQTPGGWVVVHGAEFYIQVDPDKKTSVSSIKNTVYFENAYGRVILSPGYESFALPTTKPAVPQPVDSTEFQDWKNKLNTLSD